MLIRSLSGNYRCCYFSSSSCLQLHFIHVYQGRLQQHSGDEGCRASHSNPPSHRTLQHLPSSTAGQGRAQRLPDRSQLQCPNTTLKHQLKPVLGEKEIKATEPAMWGQREGRRAGCTLLSFNAPCHLCLAPLAAELLTSSGLTHAAFTQGNMFSSLSLCALHYY